MAKVVHYPRLDTVLMIEEAIHTAGEYPTKTALWRSLPRQVMYSTFNLVLDYLEDSRKISTEGGKITWVFDSKKPKKAKAKSLPSKSTLVEMKPEEFDGL